MVGNKITAARTIEWFMLQACPSKLQGINYEHEIVADGLELDQTNTIYSSFLYKHTYLEGVASLHGLTKTVQAI